MVFITVCQYGATKFTAVDVCENSQSVVFTEFIYLEFRYGTKFTILRVVESLVA